MLHQMRALRCRIALDAAYLVHVPVARLVPHHRVAPPALFPCAVAALASHYIAVERALVVEQG